MFTGPKIDIKGLVIALDAANTKSYPGSGTTWSGLAGKANENFTLVGTVASSSHQGGVAFDGSSDYGFGDGTFIENNFVNNQSFTIESYIEILDYPTGGSSIYSNQRYQSEANPGGFGLMIVSNGTSQLASAIILTSESGSTKSHQSIEQINLEFDKPTHICYTYDSSSSTVTSYINGTLDGSTTNSAYHWTTSSASPAAVTPKIGTGTQGGWGNRLPSIYYLLRVYNRALTEEEVQQNHNSVKSRFGK